MKDYSYYLTFHDVYTQKDFLLMDQSFLEFLSAASIGSLTISDHALVSNSLQLLFLGAQSLSWRLNENILDDVVAQKQASDTISLYSTNDAGMASIWEGHKAVVRGELISQGSRLKKP